MSETFERCADCKAWKIYARGQDFLVGNCTSKKMKGAWALRPYSNDRACSNIEH